MFDVVGYLKAHSCVNDQLYATVNGFYSANANILQRIKQTFQY